MTAYGDRLPKGMVLPELEGIGNDYSFLEKKGNKLIQSSIADYPLEFFSQSAFHNRIDMLRRTMAMLTHQTYPLELMEIIIADDGLAIDHENSFSNLKIFLM